MTIYMLVHLYDMEYGMFGGIELTPFTKRLDAELELYEQYDRAYGQVDQGEWLGRHSDPLGFAEIYRMQETTEGMPPIEIMGESWRIVKM